VPHYYLTTPIYYVNDAPHVGTAYNAVNADALARWHRLLGDEVLFMTGTDEHGAKIVEAAEANGATPKEWTDLTSSSVTTTSYARPSPATTPSSSSSSSGSTTTVS
jgi:methionyl-tRNA synthetase